ncbi:hypothetical protein GCM10023176_04800 [Micromonospora coerulea]|uniref:Uncharacterized protein n=1 Tax=Micromonospora coerulea TaxID=47856 RepID=A0ABP8S7U0_9ACTN
MDLLPCGHAALAGSSRMCAHLIGTDGEDHVRILTGRELQSDLCCRACDQAAQAGEQINLLVACEGCVARCTDDDWWSVVAWRGTPGIADRPEPFDAIVVPVSLPVPVMDIAPVTAEHDSVWLILAEGGQIGRFGANRGDWDVLAQSTVPEEAGCEAWAGHRPRQRLHASADGRYAAVVNDFGRRGQVLDLVAGKVTLTLDGGGYHCETVPFSLAFVEHRGHTLIIHRTAWNRLDVSDAASGQLITARQPSAYRQGEPTPEHYLDYFHGGLHVSPGGHRLADDGWVWSPVGMPTVVDIRSWLDDNVWESEDGQSRHQLCQRAYHWNAPMCWLDDERVAVSGIGGDDEAMLAGVRIFNAVTGTEMTAFAGPTGAMFADPARLYAAAPGGLELWDPVTGQRTGTVEGFVPTHHHIGAGELASVDGGMLRRWRTRS